MGGSSPIKYVQNAVANVEQYLAPHYPGRKLKNRFSGLWAGQVGMLQRWMRHLSWMLRGLTTTSLKLVYCIGLWKLEEWMLLLKSPPWHPIWQCQGKGTWMHCLMSSAI